MIKTERFLYDLTSYITPSIAVGSVAHIFQLKKEPEGIILFSFLFGLLLLIMGLYYFYKDKVAQK